MQEIRHQHNWKQASKYITIHKVSQHVPTKASKIHSSSKTNTPNGTTIKFNTINLLSAHNKKFQRPPFFFVFHNPANSNMRCPFCEFNNITENEICNESKAYLPADPIVERVSITGYPDNIAKIEHEGKVEMGKDPSRSDAEIAEDKKCMVVNINHFGSVVSVVLNEKYVRVSAAHEDASRPGRYEPVQKAELWKAPGA
ncbi:hypothetical protein QC760_005238 [Botrytis cinerea]